ncbi:MAG TPA: DinB family protein, partial [Bacteroidota bacterium]
VRLKLTLTEDNPTIKPYDQDTWVCQADVLGVPLESSLQLLRGLHARWTLLLRALPAEAWKRTYYHPEYHESVTLESFLNTYSNHCRKHLEHINGLKRAKGW